MNETEISRLVGLLHATLEAMSAGPGPSGLERRVRFELEDREVTSDIDGAVAYLFGEIARGAANSSAHLVFARHLRAWDAISEAPWTEQTGNFTPERRSLVCSALRLSAAMAEALLTNIPIHKGFDDAVLIANEHQTWYSELRKQQAGTFYWSQYERYLQTQSGWDEAATTSLNESTDKVMHCLSDPQRHEAFAVRGLVVGYVQSGKTANFTAVIAKAMDAGYRLIIVLAGMLDSLRFQTQRRLDKELVGREQILRDRQVDQAHEYSGDQDWERFTSYGCLPVEKGGFDIRRITTSVEDYQKLGQGRDVLRFEKQFADRPLNHPDNLRTTAARLIVIKKNPAVIRKVIADLKGLQMSFDDIPALIIDDESDQASVNTVDPRKKPAEGKDTRTGTNKAIVNLLAMLPRSQYVGYTATPAANTLINPGDSLDLFPRDFIELLPRPANYMGVADFHDFDDEFNPRSKEEVADMGYVSNRNAFVRSIVDSDDTGTFAKALDAFFLTGALKLFRNDLAPGSVSTRHHTMLVHRSSGQDAHDEDRDTVRQLLSRNAYRKAVSLERLWRLWKEDFEPVSAVKEPGLARPVSVAELRPFLIQAFEKFEGSRKQVLVVNGRDTNKDDMPDFDKESVWNILVGGAKLSRGYTVEGLTISYFLRRAQAADTLMQMGRWFGFRRGYRDLVRLYLASQVTVGKAKVDLYDMFESVCMDEERFRQRIRIYSAQGIRPIQVPPLVPMGMLIPTQKNKMHNAEIAMENFGGKGAQSGRVTFAPAVRKANVARLSTLLGNQLGEPVELTGTWKDQRQSLRGRAYTVGAPEFLEFLKAYRWGTPANQFAAVIGFLSGTGGHSPDVDKWRVILMDNPSAAGKWRFNGKAVGVFERGGTAERFNVFSESRHKAVAAHLTGVTALSSPNAQLVAMTQPRQAICLIYPVVPRDFGGTSVKDTEITLGMHLEFPANRIPEQINFRVRDPKSDAAFVDVAQHN
ncbi:endonuclease [Lysobacter soli]|uniref:Z1 domain-containing protein n=1 Tax=Lysobacter soli TaxID=453783 RepID=UPI0012ED572A|nr:Z1 domain-containing protein [Lysobacter soli]QGW66673.1 endonuclease [Lysobacter soli]